MTTMGNIIPISERFSDKKDLRFDDREENVPDARTLLSTALLDTAQNDAERARLAEYQAKIGEMNAQQEKLDALKIPG